MTSICSVLFYILSVVAAGFLVAHDDPRLNPVNSPGGDAMSSPSVMVINEIADGMLTQ